MYSEYTISAETDFDSGEKFESAEQVRHYFTVANMTAMFGGEDATFSQDELDAMAATVILNRWHCAF